MVGHDIAQRRLDVGMAVDHRVEEVEDVHQRVACGVSVIQSISSRQ